ncbi:MAG: AAA family ATPase [Bacillota bacterium]|nr:AAA family ATPase [Bacillota bacterium]
MNQSIFDTGQHVFFTTNSPIHRDVYEVTIKQMYPDHIDLDLCFHNGSLLLPPVGTEISWLGVEYEHQYLHSKVIEKNLSEKLWSVSLPVSTANPLMKTRVLAVGSGKGGVGKTTFSINLALALAHLGKQVLLLDVDIGMANIEVLLSLHNSQNLADVIQGHCRLCDVIMDGPGGIKVIPGSSGIPAFTHLTPLQFNRIISGFSELENEFDFLLLDTGAGLSDLVLHFLEVADDFLLLTNPEPHALLDAYALTKVLWQRNADLKVNLIVNRCDNEKEAKQCKDSFVKALQQFMKIDPIVLGWLPYDSLVPRSNKQQVPLFLLDRRAEYSRYIATIALRVIGKEQTASPPSGMKSFWHRLKKGLSTIG